MACTHAAGRELSLWPVPYFMSVGCADQHVNEGTAAAGERARHSGIDHQLTSCD